jgi:hypothetical protein
VARNLPLAMGVALKRGRKYADVPTADADSGAAVTPADAGSRPGRVWAEIAGGDALGCGHEPALSWWLPEGRRGAR